jgi:hypothetical protein
VTRIWQAKTRSGVEINVAASDVQAAATLAIQRNQGKYASLEEADPIVSLVLLAEAS